MNTAYTKALLVSLLLLWTFPIYAQDDSGEWDINIDEDFPAFSPLPPAPSFPTPPSLPFQPGAVPQSSQNSGRTELLETVSLKVESAWSGGVLGSSAAGIIDRAEYRVYSDGSRELQVYFKNNQDYNYYLNSFRSSVEISPGVWRETCDVMVLADRRLLTDSYTAELYTGAQGPVSFTVFSGDTVTLVLGFVAVKE